MYFCSLFYLIRTTWQLVLVLTLFAEHIMLKHHNTVCYARRLHLVIGHMSCVIWLTVCVRVCVCVCVCALWVFHSFLKVMLTFKKQSP